MANNIVFTPGDTMTWTNTTGVAVASGQVVIIGKIIAVALVSIPNGESGTVLYKNAVAKCPKVSGAVIAQGDTLTWDVSAGAFDDSAATPATGDVTANVTAHRPAADGETTVDVVLNGVAGTIN